MVERTQTAHLPDPVDPTPVDQGIGVYFTELVWGRVRPWVTACAVPTPAQAEEATSPPRGTAQDLASGVLTCGRAAARQVRAAEGD